MGNRSMDTLYKNWNLELQGENISITPMRLADAQPYAQLLLGPMYKKSKELFGCEPDSGIEKILSHESENDIHALRLNDNERFIGWITLQKDEEGRPDIGISLIDECQSKGYGPEAVKLYCNWLNRQFGLERIYVRIADDNDHSKRAFTRLGAIHYAKEVDKRFTSLLPLLAEENSEFEQSTTGYYYIDLPIC